MSMRNLIRQILREYISLKVIIEEIILPENFFNELLSEGKATVNVPKYVDKQLENKIESYYNFKDHNNKWWFCPKKYHSMGEKNEICEMAFTLTLKLHWKQRLFRHLEPDYNIVHGKKGKYFDKRKNLIVPEIFEGIELVMDNIDLIVKFIKSSKNWSNKTEKHLLLKKGSYSEIIAIFKDNKQRFNINFITQIKGEFFFDTPELKKSTNLKGII